MLYRTKTRVFVQDCTGRALNSTTRCGHVRWLIKHGYSKIVNYKPFTIRLKREVPESEIKNECTVAIDPGRNNIGVSIINNKGQVVYASNISTNNADVSDHMKDKALNKSARKQGKRAVKKRRAKANDTCFKDKDSREKYLSGGKGPRVDKLITGKESRFSNRTCNELNPTLRHLIQTHISIIDQMCKLEHVTRVAIEANKFDFVKMENPGKQYQHYGNGQMKGFDSKREAIEDFQNGKCYICKSNPIEVLHHIREQHKHGKDAIDNLVGLCNQCHSKVHTDPDVKKIITKAGREKKYADLSVLNSAYPYILKALKDKFGVNVSIEYPWDTKTFRIKNNLPKDHYIDAIAIGINSLGIAHINKGSIPTPYTVKQYRRHDRAKIHHMTERTYYLNGKAVAKNRKARCEQNGDSLDQYINKLPVSDRKSTVGKLKVKPAKRSYNNMNRILPGAVFHFKGKRYVLAANHGKHYYNMVNQGKKDFSKANCKLLKYNTGLVYL